MREYAADDFVEFFGELWGRRPFSWQLDLAARVLNGGPWPQAIALPTGAGKTACLDIAVFALASQAGRLERGERMTAARRVFYVVDRRVIVDEAYRRACRMAERLAAARSGILADVAGRLRHLAQGPVALACFELRGGMYRSDEWASSPIQPMVVAATVDQVGSRLLFRAYGRASGAWPIHAGLVGNDSLVLLDEAHCARPFMETAGAVARYRTWAERPLHLPFHFVVMSATPPEEVSDVFRDDSAERRDPAHPLGRRQTASKPARMEIVQGTRGAGATGRMARALAAKALLGAQSRLPDGSAPAVVVFANRVATAREAWRLLAQKFAEDALLLTGRMRPIDRDDTVSARLSVLGSERAHERALERPLVVVATQTIEVGADLDFDALVTECASLDALRQRFGRLNRTGRAIAADAFVLVREDQAAESADDPVYGPALAETWKWLCRLGGEGGTVDFGILAMEGVLPGGEDLKRLSAPARHAFVMLPAHVDAWAQTALEPEPTPEVSLFLHGPVGLVGDIMVCWRADVDASDEERMGRSLEAVALCPPSLAECVPVPVAQFRRWLAGEEDDPGTDVEGEVGPAPEGGDAPVRRAIRWRGLEDAVWVEADAGLRPGDVFVVPAGEGGWDVLGDIPAGLANAPVLDWGDRANWQTRARPVLRLHQEVVRHWPAFSSRDAVLGLLEDSQVRFEEEPDGLLADVRDALAAVAADEGAPRWLRDVTAALSADPGLEQGLSPHPLGGLVLRGRRRTVRVWQHDFSDEDDASASGTSDVWLDDHLRGVEGLAGCFAKMCGLDEDLAEAVRLAAAWHDLGKADPRFQAWLRGGQPLAGARLLAKSERMPRTRVASERARRASGYPRGGRHELLSVRLVERLAASRDPGVSDLLLHLMESHHGHCRPFAPVVTDEDPVTVSVTVDGQRVLASSRTGMERLDSGASSRFWACTRRFGWWGLAFIEALVRLADHRRSEAEERGET